MHLLFPKLMLMQLIKHKYRDIVTFRFFQIFYCRLYEILGSYQKP